MSKTILVTGGAGFIGSAVNLMLNDAGYTTFVLDNLSSGDKKAVIAGTLIEGDLTDENKLNKLFSEHPIDAVMHFAALTDVGESVEEPALYYKNNVQGTFSLLESMRKAKVKYLIFSSSAAVYGIPTTEKVVETSPCKPINPYGRTKLIDEQILTDFQKAYGINTCSLRYFNAAGGDPSGRLKHYKKKENNLIPIVLDAILKNKTVTVFGSDYSTRDGTCIRDYIHVFDLGSAHLLALEKLFTGNETSCYNLGNGQGFTVLDVIKAAEKVTGKKINVNMGPRRAGDPPVLLADAIKAERDLGWKPKYPQLEVMIEHAWKARKS